MREKTIDGSWRDRVASALVGRSAGAPALRRQFLLWVAAGTGALAAGALAGLRVLGVDARGYREVARWPLPGGEGLFIATGPEPTVEGLRALGEALRREYGDRDNVVVMVFDDPEAARRAHRGSRVVGEERFQTALAHQRAMYIRHRARGVHSLTIYEAYPAPREVIRY
ncbi:MAG: hypothetical protein HYY19_00835 [Candidatus Rokubacteria bacterium]|nr:hypothetical protein [Candidatus Rokubacteria bacterium]